jgi:hypothetical protein
MNAPTQPQPLVKLNRKHAGLLLAALDDWKQLGLLDDSTTHNLAKSIEVATFDWRRLAKYSVWVAIICILTSVGAVLADQKLMEILQQIFNAPDSVKLGVFSALSAFIYYLGLQRRNRHPEKIFTNEAVLAAGVLTTAGAVHQLGNVLHLTGPHFSMLFLISTGVYALLGYRFKSNLIWLFSLLSLGCWMGAETGYASGWGAYYLGMNYPLRFVLFGGFLTAAAFLLQNVRNFEIFHRVTAAMGLLYLFIALWILSIFGNYGDFHSWRQIQQIELFHWSLLFGLASAGAIFHGLRTDNGMTKGFGITFLFINLYTRYFEYFWDGTHKAIFFGIIGVSFWYLGTHAEKIWRRENRMKSLELAS